MKQILLFLSLVFAQSALVAQVKTAGVNYSVGAPAWTPSVNTASELAIDTVSKRLYLWNRNTATWDIQGRGVDQTSGSTPPAYTPNQTDSYLALNNANPPELYAWTGSAWAKVGGTVQTIDTFSVSGSIVSLSLSGDGQPARTITLPASGITSLNSQTGATQIFATGTTGTDVGIVSSTNTHTFNYPNASASARGLLTNADWSTFNGKVGGSGVSGQVGYFSGTSTLAGSNNFFWDNTNGRLGVGINASLAARLHVVGAGSTSATFTAQFHNAFNNNNAFLIRDDGALGFGTASFSERFNFGFNQNGITIIRNSNINSLSGAATGIVTGVAGQAFGMFAYPSTYTANATRTGRGIFDTDSGLSNGMRFLTSAGGIDFAPVSTVRMQIATSGSVQIGTTTEAASAVLNVTSTTKGFLPPRMTADQAGAIASPAEGLMVYVTNTNGTFTSKGWYGYNGAAWEKLNN
jgi:hypothetical protein